MGHTFHSKLLNHWRLPTSMALPCAAPAAPVRLAPADLAVPIGAISAGRSVKRRGALGAWAELLYNIQIFIIWYIYIYNNNNM